MIPEIDTLLELGYFSNLDYFFAKTMGHITKDTSPLTLLGAAVASAYTRFGHVCAPIFHIAGSCPKKEDGETLDDFLWPDRIAWEQAFKDSPLVGDGTTRTPLVFREGRLYLFRYWNYEDRLAKDLLHRARPVAERFDDSVLSQSIDRFFSSADEKNRQQRHAAFNTLKNHLTVISGGPGTGKTTTVLKILLVVLSGLSEEQRAHFRIMLMAPTGKAAARVSESIRTAKSHITGLLGGSPVEILSAIPDSATTIHKALKMRHDNSTRFVYTRDNPLPSDIVIADEASMIDVALMTKLFDAVPKDARIVLLGDKDQLASVEAGSVLGDICDFCTDHGNKSPLSETVIHLNHSFRFDSKRGIGRLSAAINQGDMQGILTALERDGHQQIGFVDCNTAAELEKRLKAFVLSNYRKYRTESAPLQSLEEFEKFRILCPHRRGTGGVEHLNRLTEQVLKEQSLIDPRQDAYEGRPILVTQNDPHLDLWNGDLGMVCRRQEDSPELAAFFRGADLKEKIYSLSRLPNCETVFAMTVHKSQGSEYDEVLLVLPERPSPVLTRELLYTAVTRARKRVTILGSKKMLQYAVKNTTKRTSGLRETLAHHTTEQLSFEFE